MLGTELCAGCRRRGDKAIAGESLHTTSEVAGTEIGERVTDTIGPNLVGLYCSGTWVARVMLGSTALYEANGAITTDNARAAERDGILVKDFFGGVEVCGRARRLRGEGERSLFPVNLFSLYELEPKLVQSRQRDVSKVSEDSGSSGTIESPGVLTSTFCCLN